ncbi:PaaX family transcriptional regulator C-terminal domain-containing protein [Amycolatopsis sp. RTGN1]|uniref:PaaX family transcriptional regulator C-terminal domain-containing protein n=1 Tax=Amycolatopsis ponsaeliensis TaxID=2992142 RepID=UPI0025510E20|nr:PaaX family transcriptional regulator C-terminal domain-containing protein [Amycolatopsis sp. RTGN1]
MDRPARIAGEAWDLAGIADGYTRFLRRWTGGAFADLDDLSRRVRPGAEWLIRRDPVLPPALLPEDWPGVRAAALFAELRHHWARPARKLTGKLLGSIVDG